MLCDVGRSVHGRAPFICGREPSQLTRVCCVPGERHARSETAGSPRHARSKREVVAATEWLDDGAPVVSVMGELDLATAPALEETFLGLADGARPVVVDLSRCSFIESASLKVLIATERRLNRSGRQLALVVCNPCVSRVFEITRLDEFFAIYPSLDLALEG